MPFVRRFGLALILLLAVAVRWIGIDREIPHRIEPDPYLVWQTQRLAHDPALIHREHYNEPYPSLTAHLFALLPAPEIPARASGAGDEKIHLDAAARPFLLVRTGVAACSVLGVLLSFLLARRFLSPSTALLVPYLVATCLLSILFAGQGRPHGIQATVALAAVLLALRVGERASLGRILLAAGAAALAGATLQNGLFTLLPLAAGIGFGSSGGKRLATAARAGLACLAAAAVSLAFFPGLPYVDAHGIHLGSTDLGSHTIHPTFTGLAGVPRILRMMWEFDPVLTFLATVGAIVALVGLWRHRRDLPTEKKRDLAIVLVYALPYLGALALDPSVYERFILPLIPYIACLAAAGLAWILARVRGLDPVARPRHAAALVLGGLILFAPAYVAARYARTAAAPDTLEQAADWIRKNADPTERILSTPGTVLPLLCDADALREDLKDPSTVVQPWFIYQSLLPAVLEGDPRWKILLIPISSWRGHGDLDFERSQALIRDSRVGVVVLEDSRRMHEYFPISGLEQAAASMGELVYRTDGQIPRPTDGGIFEYSGTRELAWRLLSADAFGPGMLIYRIRR